MTRAAEALILRGVSSRAEASTTPATLGDLLAVPSLAGARCLGPPALGARVECVVVADADAPAEAGALVLAPGAPPDPLPAGCAAVVCRAAPDAEPTVPVIVVPPGAPWGPVVAELAAALPASGAGRPLRDARDALRGPLLAGSGFGGLVATAAELVDAPVVVLDEYLDVLGAAGLDDALSARLDAAVEAARGHSPASVLGPFMEEELTDLPRLALEGPGDHTGVLVAFIDGARTPSQDAALAALAEAAAVEQARERVRIETESRLRGDLIEELAAGETVGRESVVRRARHLGADLAPGAVALVGVLHDPHDEGRVITDERLVRRFMKQARAAIDLHWPRSLIDRWQDGLVALLPPPAPGPAPDQDAEVSERASILAARLLAATRETVPGTALTIGISRYTREPERLGLSLQEARLALAIGERLGRVGELITFEETGTYKLLFQIFADRPGELDEFYEGTIEPLVAYDHQYQTELVVTLATYLGKDCNLAATAGALFTHRHTVRYRLDRIADISGLEVARTDDREKLSLGLKAMRLLGLEPRSADAGRQARRARPRSSGQAGRSSNP